MKSSVVIPSRGHTQLMDPHASVHVSWGLWVIPDGELLGHDGPLLDLGFEVSPWAGALNFVFPNLKHSVFTDLYHSITSPVQVRLF